MRGSASGLAGSGSGSGPGLAGSGMWVACTSIAGRSLVFTSGGGCTSGRIDLLQQLNDRQPTGGPLVLAVDLAEKLMNPGEQRRGLQRRV
jgi:hypothetical protein